MVGPRAITHLNRSTLSSTLKRPALAIATVIMLLAAPMVSLMPAREAGAESFFGCNVVAGSPAIEDGEVVASAMVECQVAWSNRVIRTELWQLASGGGWAPIEDSITTWEGSDRVLPLHYPDSTGIDCAILDDSTRDYQSRIFIDDGAGHVAVVVSERMRLNRDCLAASGVLEPTNRVGAEGGGGVTCGILPSRPALVSGGRLLRARTVFDCDEIDRDQVRYLRVRMVENTPGPIDKVVRNRAFADTLGAARSITLTADCTAKSARSVTYYNHSRETIENADGSQTVPPGSNRSSNVILDARCKN